MRTFNINNIFVFFISCLVIGSIQGQNILPRVQYGINTEVEIIAKSKFRSNSVSTSNKVSVKEFYKERITIHPESMYRPHLLSDTGKIINNIKPIRDGMAPLLSPYSGNGVVFGIIDTGIESDHPDFIDDNGDTRIMYQWDQANDGVGSHPKFSYGSFYDSSDINSGSFLDTDPTSHGTTVAGVAVGGGKVNSSYEGVAPDAKIVLVNTDFNKMNWLTTVADAVEYIFEKADALGLPCVINISAGSYFGAHDGLDPSSIRIDSMLDAKNGRVVVCAAGNSGNFNPYHLRTQLSGDSAFTWFNLNTNLGGQGITGVFFEAWSNTPDFDNIEFQITADKISPTYSRVGRSPYLKVSDLIGLPSNRIDNIIGVSGNTLGTVEYFAVELNGRYLLQAFVENPDSTQYKFGFNTRGSGTFDIWCTSQFGLNNMEVTVPTSLEFPQIVNYSFPDNNSSIVSGFSCSEKVITVGNYYKNIKFIDWTGSPYETSYPAGEIDPKSSKGPTRVNITKPDISATGTRTIAPGSKLWADGLKGFEPFKVDQTGYYVTNGGTSNAAPFVAGTVVLMFEHCSELSYADVKDALLNSSKEDANTGPTPNNIYGHGKLDGFNAVINSIYKPQINYGTLDFCENDSIVLTVKNNPQINAWKGGSNSNSYTVKTIDTVFVSAKTTSGCEGSSDTLYFNTLKAPLQPVIYQSNDTLFTSQHDYYQWFVNGTLIPFSNNWFLKIETDGEYQVKVYDPNSCTNESELTPILISDVFEYKKQDFVAYPNPIKNTLNIKSGNELNSNMLILDINGKIIHQNKFEGKEIQLNLSFLESGIYFLLIEEGNHQLKIIKE